MFNGELLLNLSGVVYAKSLYVIERGDDDVISNFKASESPKKWGKGLSNEGGEITLLDGNGKLVDSAQCEKKWCAGDSKKKASMERDVTTLEWRTSSEFGQAIDSKGNKIIGSPFKISTSIKTIRDGDSGNELAPKITFSITSGGSGEFLIKPMVENEVSGRNYRVRVIGDVRMWSDKLTRWIFPDASWNRFPKYESGMNMKIKLIKNQSSDIAVEVRDSLNLKTFRTEVQKLTPLDHKKPFIEVLKTGSELPESSSSLELSQTTDELQDLVAHEGRVTGMDRKFNPILYVIPGCLALLLVFIGAVKVIKSLNGASEKS